MLAYSLFSALPRKPESAVQLFLCRQELQLWKHQSLQFIRAALINIAMGSHLNWGQHWKLQAIQAQTSKSEAKDRWHGIKRVRWGVMMETQHSGWYWAFWKAALATSAVSPFLPLAIPPQPGFATVCYQESKCGKAAFLPVCFELSMPSPIHILTLQLREIATASPCWDLYLQLQKEHDYKPAAWIPL